MGAMYDSSVLGIRDDIQNSPSSSTLRKLAKVELQVWDSVDTAKLSLTAGKSAIDAFVDSPLRGLSFRIMSGDDVDLHFS